MIDLHNLLHFQTVCLVDQQETAESRGGIIKTFFNNLIKMAELATDWYY